MFVILLAFLKCPFYFSVIQQAISRSLIRMVPWFSLRIILIKREVFLAAVTCIKVMESDMLSSDRFIWKTALASPVSSSDHVLELLKAWYVTVKNKCTFLSGQMTLLASFWQTHKSFYSHIKTYWSPNSPYLQQFINGDEILKCNLV